MMLYFHGIILLLKKKIFEEIISEIKIEKFNLSGNIHDDSDQVIDEDTGFVINENITNDDNSEVQINGDSNESTKLKTLSVILNRLSKSQLRNYSKVNEEPINSNKKVTESTSKSCERCEKTFSTSKYLKIHMETVHEGVKKYKCKKCEKSFGQAGHLKTHYDNVHMRLKNYKCNKCGKYFSEARNLRRHNEIIHEGLKKYQCYKCGKSFGQAEELKKHNEVVHEGLKKYRSQCFSRHFNCQKIGMQCVIHG